MAQFRAFFNLGWQYETIVSEWIDNKKTPTVKPLKIMWFMLQYQVVLQPRLLEYHQKLEQEWKSQTLWNCSHHS